MCDALTAITGLLSVGSAVASYEQQSELQSKQEDANNQWVAYQQRIRQQEDQRQEDMRQKADAARQDMLTTLDPGKQKDAQAAESDRLDSAMTQGMAPAVDSSTVADQLLSGQASGGQNFKDDAAKRIGAATTAARNRIKALADIQSYGGSFNGLQTQNRINFGNADNAIGLQNNMRNGSLKTFGVEQQVEPVRYTAGPNLFGSVAGALAGVAGKGIGRSFAGGV